MWQAIVFHCNFQLHFVRDWLRNPSGGALRQKSNIVPFQSCLDTRTSQYVNMSRHESINVHSICPDNQVRFMCHPSPPPSQCAFEENFGDTSSGPQKTFNFTKFPTSAQNIVNIIALTLLEYQWGNLIFVVICIHLLSISGQCDNWSFKIMLTSSDIALIFAENKNLIYFVKFSLQ